MRERIQKLSPRGEFFLIITICFGYITCTSLAVLLLRIRTYDLTSLRIIRGMATEIIILAVAGWILHVRGWRLSQLTKAFSWPAALAGIPLFACYIAAYWVTAIAVVSIYPAASHIETVRMVPRAPIVLMVLFVIVNSVFEETMVCGYVITALSSEGAALSISASTLLRFLYHLYQGPVASLSILPLGLIFSVVYWRWKNLWPLWVAHTVANVLAFAFATAQQTR